MARYTIRIAGGAAAEFDLAGPVEIGRDPGRELPLVDDPLVSSRHARVTPTPDGVLVDDLGSRNGTFVNGVRIEASTLAKPGDVIRVGDTAIEVREVPPPEYLLEVIQRRGGPRKILLYEPLEIGRNPSADLALVDDHTASWTHARLTPLVDGVAVEDLGSRNGTFVNDVRITEPTLVQAGDRIVLGNTAIEVREAPAPEYFLEIVEGHGAGRQIRLSEPLEIGRDSSNDLALVDPLVSSRHARVTPTAQGVLVEDLGSRNGTFVNGEQIHDPTRVGLVDQIRVGSTVLEPRRGRELAAGLTAVRTVVQTAVETRITVPPQPSAAAVGPMKQEAQETEAPRRPGWTFFITSTALFMAVLDNLVVLFALSSIRSDLGASVQELEWTVNAYTLAFAVFLLPAATLGDRFGRRRVFALGIALFTVSSLVCALAPTIEVLLVGRVVQGTGAAAMTPLSLTLLSAAFPDEKRGLALGAWSGVSGIAVALGPVVGGLLVTGISWQWIFWLNVPIGAVIAPLCLFRLRESVGSHSHFDLPGAALVSTGLFGIVFGVIRGGAVGWTATQVIVPLVAGCLLVGAFIVWEQRASAPMLAMHLFRSRAFSAANGASLCMYFGIFGSIFLVTQFLQTAQGYSALEAGLRSLPWTGMPIFAAPIAGVLAERVGGRPLIVVGLTMQTAALAWLALVLDPDVPYTKLVAPFILGGVGMGLFFAPLAIVILGAVRLEEEGQASGANNAIRETGGVFGVAALVTIFAAYGSYSSPQDFTDGVIAAAWVGAVVVSLGALTALAIPAMRPKEQGFPMTAVIPAAGGLVPSLTLVRPAVMVRSPESAVAGRAAPEGEIRTLD